MVWSTVWMFEFIAVLKWLSSEFNKFNGNYVKESLITKLHFPGRHLSISGAATIPVLCGRVFVGDKTGDSRREGKEKLSLVIELIQVWN